MRLFSTVFFFAVASAESTLATTAQPSSGYVPIVTPAPDQDTVLARQGFRQETYYSCNTVGSSTHCGWHVPIVRAAATSTGSGCGGVVAVVIGFVAGFALAVT
ncbi:hypothetical protein CP533_6081 [Ophiocordyceps camponoti-saundersi (nom. inval.)]|nr:hypothetical protein CP533_6081 [Ophiocordyceps camponoti-saundersi (nom. inval.)]